MTQKPKLPALTESVPSVQFEEPTLALNLHGIAEADRTKHIPILVFNVDTVVKSHPTVLFCKMGE